MARSQFSFSPPIPTTSQQMMESSSNQPQEELPVSPITMSQYVNKVRRLWSDMKGAGHDNFDGAMARYLEYGIAGIDRKRKKRYSLDLSEQSLSINWWSSHRFQTIMRKDIDSLLGRDITIPWKDAIELYPLFEAGFPIQKGLHIGPSPYVLNKNLQEYQIPQLVIGVATALHSTIRLILPALHVPGEPPTVDEETKRTVYKLMRSAAVRQNPAEDGHWPPTYEAEKKRAAKHNGRHQKSGKLIRKSMVRKFGDRFLRYIRQHPFGKNAYYFHEVRGVRASTHHKSSLHEESLDEFLSMLDQTAIDSTQWYVDIGYEIHTPGHVLLWRRDGHIWVIQQALGLTLPDDMIELISPRNSHLEIDLTCHMFDVAGFRLTVPKRIHEETGIYYLQAYCTEKQAVYLAAGRALELPYRSTVTDNTSTVLEQYKETMDGIIPQFIDNETAGNARLEVRVRLDRARDIPNIQIRGDDATNTLFQIKSLDYWYFKLERISCMIQSIISWRNSEDITAKVNRQSLSLVLCLVYMINAMNSRPKSWSGEEKILEVLTKGLMEVKSVEMTTLDDDDLEMSYQYHRFGILFPKDLIGWSDDIPTPHLGQGLIIPDDVFQRLTGVNCFLLQTSLLPPSVDTDQESNEGGNAKSRKYKRPIQHVGPTAEADIIRISPNDVGLSTSIRGNGEQGHITLINRLSDQITLALSRFYMDILLIVPVAKGGKAKGAYCRLSKPERLKATAEHFQNPDLSSVFSKVYVCEGTPETWTQAFERLFPTEEKSVSQKHQNFKRCEYYQNWSQVLRVVDKRSKKVVQGLVKNRIDQLMWIPNAATDRIWTSCSKMSSGLNRKNAITMYPSNAEGPAPIIITNPNWVASGKPRWFLESGRSTGAEERNISAEESGMDSE